MKVGLAQYTTPEVEDKTSVITELSDRLSELFREQYFGEDLLSLTIGIICVNPDFEQFFKKQKKYYKGSRSITHEGITIEVKNALEYSIKLPFEKFREMGEEEATRFILEKVYDSLSEISEIKKVNDFDLECFKEYYKQNLL